MLHPEELVIRPRRLQRHREPHVRSMSLVSTTSGCVTSARTFSDDRSLSRYPQMFTSSPASAAAFAVRQPELTLQLHATRFRQSGRPPDVDGRRSRRRLMVRP